MTFLQKLLLLICISGLTFKTSGQYIHVPLPASKYDFIVIAHRGSHLIKPENTIAAIEDAIKLGADYVEIDIRTTKDGQLVLSHNATVEGQTNGRGEVRNLTWSELSILTISGKDGKTYRIPKFTEALKACKGKINIYLDFKDADVAAAYREIKAAGMEKQLLVYLNKHEQYGAWRKIAPEVPLMGSLPETVKTKADLQEFCSKINLEAIDNGRDELMLTALKEAGISVFLDAQSRDESPVSWKPLLDKGIQGLQTDHPEALINYLNEIKLRKKIKL